jgi:hypothetical protein
MDLTKQQRLTYNGLSRIARAGSVTKQELLRFDQRSVNALKARGLLVPRQRSWGQHFTVVPMEQAELRV